MKTSLVFALAVLMCGFPGGSFGEYMFLNKKKTWGEAQSFCRQYYTDLATITSMDDNILVKKAAGRKFTDSWIGLHRSTEDPTVWQWSDLQQSSFFNWKDPPDDSLVSINIFDPEDTKNCVQITNKGWEEKDCSDQKPFFCYSTLVLVKEKKTWEEAYEYCRSNFTSLAFVTSDNEQQLLAPSQTASVWTGLRFMAGEWLWVNGEPLENPENLASCPAPPYQCGARNSETSDWENRDCEEKLNFLCY